MEDEFNSLQQMGTFEIVAKEDVPSDIRTVTSKWVLKKKRDEDGKIAKYKARVVARGFSQIEGENYDETFAPTTGLTTTRLILILAQLMGMKTFHFDVKTAYLYGKLDYEIYMIPPTGMGKRGEL